MISSPSQLIRQLVTLFLIASAFPVQAVLSAARQVGRISDTEELSDELRSPHSGMRYWGLIALEAYEGDISSQRERLAGLLDDPSSAVAVKAAELLVSHFDDERGLETLKEKLLMDREAVVLQAAVSVRQIGEKPRPFCRRSGKK
jgi:hypothetical protein